MDKKATIDAETTLGSPFIPDFTDYTRKIRNYLIIVGSVSIIMIIQNLQLEHDASFLGLKFKNLDMDLIYHVFLWVELYFLIHFLWLALDNFFAWRLRFSGTHKIYKGGYSLGNGADNEPDTTQTTLYFWWKDQALKFSNHKISIDLIESKFNDLNKAIESSSMVTQDITKELSELRQRIDTLNTTYAKSAEIISSRRIPDSLALFNNWFKYYHNIQGWRWILIELALPVVIGITAIFLLLFR